MPRAIALLPRAPSRRRAVARAGRARRRRWRSCAAGECDIALTIDAPFACRGRRRAIDRVHLLDDPMYVALPREHPLAAQAEAASSRSSRGLVDRRLERRLPGHADPPARVQRRRLRAADRLPLRRLPGDPGLRRGGRGRVAHPRPRAARRARRRRDPLARRAAAGPAHLRRDAARRLPLARGEAMLDMLAEVGRRLGRAPGDSRSLLTDRRAREPELARRSGLSGRRPSASQRDEVAGLEPAVCPPAGRAPAGSPLPSVPEPSTSPGRSCVSRAACSTICGHV